MNHLLPWGLTRFLAAILLVSVLTGCNTTVYESAPQPPPPPPEVQYVPPPPPEEAPPPPEPVYTPPPAPVVVVEIRAESDFYEPLDRYGRWVEVEGYGRCWTPGGVEREWRPYTRGRWCRTDAGWYWESDEPWGWATCHYGRWFFDPNLGWVWVPHTQWAPAWVAWRDGGGYTGWAPLPPRVRFRADGALERPDDDIDPNSFVFVEQRRMLEPQRPQTVIVNNITVVQQTINVTKVVVVNKTVINEGPSPEVVARATGHAVNVVPAHVLRTQHEAPAIARDHLHTAMFQPSLVPAAAHPRPDLRRNEGHNPRPNVPVQPQPQHAIVPENPPRPPAEARPYVPPNQPRQSVEQPAPRPPASEQGGNDQNSHRQLPPSNEQREPGLHKPGNQPSPPLDRGRIEAGHPVPEANKPGHRPEGNPPPVHPVPGQPRPEANSPGREPVPYGKEVNRPGQPIPPQQLPQHQPAHEQEKAKQAGGKPHSEEPKDRHSSTNAPPQQR